MITEELIRRLLTQGESDILEFKEKQGAFTGSEEQRAEFTKDMLALANTRRDRDAFLIFGVRFKVGETPEVVGQEQHPDPGDVQQFLDSRTNRPIRFEHNVVLIDGKKVGVYRLPKEQDRPLYLTRGFDKGIVRASLVFCRRAGTTSVMTPDEIMRLAPIERRAGKWEGEYGDQLRAMVDRWFKIFRAHGVQQTWIPDLLPAFQIPLDMLTDWRDTARLLQDQQLRNATCELFNIRPEWLEEGGEIIFNVMYLSSHHIGCFLKRLADCKRQALLPQVVAFKSSRRKLGAFGQHGALLIRREIAIFGETIIYHNIPVFSVESWSDPTHRYIAKCLLMAADKLGFELWGGILPKAQLRSLRGGEVFPEELKPWGFGWHPVDYVYQDNGFPTKDRSELQEIMADAEKNGFMAEIRKLLEEFPRRPERPKAPFQRQEPS